MTQEEIKSSLSLSSQKSIRYAIRRLLENAIIHRVPNLLDMRSVSYRLATPSELSTAFGKLSNKVFQDVVGAMNMSNSQMSEFKVIAKS